LGEIKSLQLSDGTHVWLNTASAFNVEITAQQRIITLLQGEILIETAKNDKRPLLVNTSQGQLRPIGTKFTVHQQEDATQVDVFDGAVEITIHPKQTRHKQTHPKQIQIVNAGQQTSFTTAQVSEINSADAAKEAWSQGILLAEDISLKELVEQLSRYQYTYINLADEVAHLSVYGSYPLKSPEQILTMLANVLPIKVTYILPWWINIEASDN
jgi:transmembrane sensor